VTGTRPCIGKNQESRVRVYVSSYYLSSLGSLCSLLLSTDHDDHDETLTSHHNVFWLELESFVFQNRLQGFFSGR
jgi:hypothetical protein